MRVTWLPILAIVLAVGTRASGVETSVCEQGLDRGGAGAANGAVVLSRPEGPSLLPASRGEAAFRLLGNRRLRVTRTSALVAAERVPAQLELAFESAGATVAAGDWCSGIADLVTRRLDGVALAHLLGLPLGPGDAAPPRLVLRAPGTTAALLAGAPGEITFRRPGCATVCAPALTASCRVACDGQPRRCVRDCRRGGLQACRQTGSCRKP